MQEFEGVNSERQSLDAAIGEAVRGARKSRGLTLKDLSSSSGVSVAMISKIERGQVSASVATLDALARAAGIPVANFFASTVEQKEISFVKAGSGISVQRTGSTYGHSYKMIGRVSEGGTEFEAFEITLEDSATGEPMFQHPGVEFIYVIDGELDYQCGEDVFELSPGDSLTFGTMAPHGPVRLKEKKATFLTIIARPR